MLRRKFAAQTRMSKEKQAMIIGRIVTVLLSLVLVAASGTAQRRGTYSNPVIAGDFPDPSVIRVGKDYWATMTTGALPAMSFDSDPRGRRATSGPRRSSTTGAASSSTTRRGAPKARTSGARSASPSPRPRASKGLTRITARSSVKRSARLIRSSSATNVIGLT
jgi:hypothetical protein